MNEGALEMKSKFLCILLLFLGCLIPYTVRPVDAQNDQTDDSSAIVDWRAKGTKNSILAAFGGSINWNQPLTSILAYWALWVNSKDVFDYESFARKIETYDPNNQYLRAETEFILDGELTQRDEEYVLFSGPENRILVTSGTESTGNNSYMGGSLHEYRQGAWVDVTSQLTGHTNSDGINDVLFIFSDQNPQIIEVYESEGVSTAIQSWTEKGDWLHNLVWQGDRFVKENTRR
jgi:hypothetical protein